MGWREAFHFFKRTPFWAVVIGLINLVGIVYGFVYYAPQFATTPWPYWIFVPDSPLAVLWAELALLAYWLKRESAALDALAFVGNVQVGLWTVYVLLAYADDFGTYTLNLNTILLAGHAGMAVLALIFVQGLRERRARSPRSAYVGIGVALAYYLVNDALDYFGPDFKGKGCGLRPYTVPCYPGTAEPTLAAVTFGLTLLATGGLLLAIKGGRIIISSRQKT